MDRRRASRRSDLSGVDIRRFAPFNSNNQWLHDRVGEVLGLHYAIPWPNRELETARPFRRSPAYRLLAEAGACFGSKMGWERANVFAPEGTTPVIEYGWGKPNWLPWSDAEQVATRRDVALFDQTSFGKLLVKGRDAEALAAVAVHRGRRRGAGPGGLHRDAQLPGRLRVRPHRHPTRPPTSTCW